MKDISTLVIFFVVFLWLFALTNRIEEIKSKSIKQDSLFKELYYSVIDTFEKEAYLVTVTTFNATKSQCDASPNRTACNYLINKDVNKQRIVGLSRDLLNEFYYGEKIILENCKQFNGEYTVVDCGNRRLIRTVDICINRNTLGGKFTNVILRHKY